MALFEAYNVSVSFYKNGELFTPLTNISFSLDAGCLYNITGPSGSGKSTLLNACALMIPRDSGTFSLQGIEATQLRPEVWRRHVCLVPQAAPALPGTVRDNLLSPWTLKVNAGFPKPSDNALMQLLSLAQLEEVALDHAASQLSGGQLARVALLRAFITRPTVMLLDEVEAALDDSSALAVSRLTRAFLAGGTTCLRIRHRAEDGFAYGTFELENGHLSYRQNDQTEFNTPLSAHDKTNLPEGFEVVSDLAIPPVVAVANLHKDELSSTGFTSNEPVEGRR